MRWMVRGDVDGFFGLALDNLVQLILIDTLCRHVLGFSDALLYGHVLPGVAVSLLVGNLFYAWQARQLGLRERRGDVCALPYGINTVSLFGHVFLVMLPARMAAAQAGAADPSLVAWQAGLAATVGSGLIELGGSLVAERIRKATPRAALLATLAGIALTFISIGFLYRTYARPVVGLTTLAIVMMTYFGRVRFKGGLPGGLVAVALGTLLAWLSGVAPVGDLSAASFSFRPPVPVLGDLHAALTSRAMLTYISIIIPMGLFNLVGSLQNIESADAAGDRFRTGPSLAVNGLGSLAAALFGSCFPTTIYIGHPGWKALGARAGYSILNGVFITLLCLTGTLAHVAWAVPVEAGMAIVLWIGLVITAQAFQAVPRSHAPAVVVGLLPGVAAWGALQMKASLRVGAEWLGVSANGPPHLSDTLVPFFAASDMWIKGVFALEQGFIFTSMILAAVVVAIIERRWMQGAIWCGVATALCCVGLMHSFRWAAGDTVIDLQLIAPWRNPWATGYLAMGVVMLLARWVTVPDEAA
ncbi:MAG TPA: NCS2 family permease [Planctomycetota bacterium]|nr:NCS2 family permease [Planctomycetota bacterium]